VDGDLRPHHSTQRLSGGAAAEWAGAGGWRHSPHGFHSFNAAEQYNPATGMWTATNSLKPGRYAHTATLLGNGQVLVAGGAPRTGTLTRSQLYTSAP
jgi:hypothetical protein